MTVGNIMEHWKKSGEPQVLPPLQDFNNLLDQYPSGTDLAFGH